MKKVLVLGLLGLTSCGRECSHEEKVTVTEEVTVKRLPKYRGLSEDCQALSDELLAIAQTKGTANEDFRRVERDYLYYCE